MDTNNLIGRFDRNTGELTESEISTPNSLPGSIRDGPDGAMWFVERNANKIGRITMDGKLTQFEIQRQTASRASSDLNERVASGSPSSQPTRSAG
jgi:streptogramin lyase